MGVVLKGNWVCSVQDCAEITLRREVTSSLLLRPEETSRVCIDREAANTYGIVGVISLGEPRRIDDCFKLMASRCPEASPLHLQVFQADLMAFSRPSQCSLNI
jgi:hypothetical protein